MRKLRYYLVFILVLLTLPLQTKAEDSNIVYGINSINVYSDYIRIKGWGYIPEINFCNSSNYANYEMTYPKTGDDYNSQIANTYAGYASDCANKGKSSVIYNLFLISENANAIPYKIKSEGDNSRTEGVSATCVNYWAPGYNGKSLLCDNEAVPYGESSDKRIDYKQRNYNIQNNYMMPSYVDGGKRYFYDDIGFDAKIDTTKLQSGYEYKLQLCITYNGERTTTCNDVAVPGVAIFDSDTNLNLTKDEGSIWVSRYSDENVYNFGDNTGFVKETSAMPRYEYKGKWYAIGPNVCRNGEFFCPANVTNGGGYYYNAYYPITSIRTNYTGGGNPERTGGLPIYMLGTEESFRNYNGGRYLFPGSMSYSKYGAIPSWVQFEGLFKIRKDKSVSICGNTEPNTIERENYCKQGQQLTDYISCCVNPNENNCPIANDKPLTHINAKEYIYWDSSKEPSSSITKYTDTNNNVITNSKYCSGTDKTETIVMTDSMEQEYNNAFCYQTGEFTTSGSKNNRILTYAGGSYYLDVDYKTTLKCAYLSERKIEAVEYFNENCESVDGPSKGEDSDIKFTGASGNSIKYSEKGKFNIEDMKNQIEKVPNLILSDTTTGQTATVFEQDMTYIPSNGSSSYTKDSEIYKYINNNGIKNPLGDNNDITRTFTTKVELKKQIEEEKDLNSIKIASCDYAPENIYYGGENSNYYYGYINKISCSCDSSGNNCKAKYKGTITKKVYVLIKETYKEASTGLKVKYKLNDIPDTIKERFPNASGKYTSQVNLSDYYQIKVDSTNYRADRYNNTGSGLNSNSRKVNSSSGTGNAGYSTSSRYKGFGIAGQWYIDDFGCALDLTSFPDVCDPKEEDCDDLPYCDPNKEKCKDGNDPIGKLYRDTFSYRVVSTTALFPGKSVSNCKNPTSLCRQPGRNWNKYLISNDKSNFLLASNIDFTPEKPMYHIELSPITMKNIVDKNKEYYTNINLGKWYNPSSCISSTSRCTSDYESDMLDGLGSAIFTRSRDVIYGRYADLNKYGVNQYLTKKGG